MFQQRSYVDFAQSTTAHTRSFFFKSLLRVVLLLHPLVHLVLRNTSRSILTHYLSHTIFDTPSFIQLCHTPSFTHNFVTLSLSHTTFTHTLPFTHTTLSHTIFDTWSFTRHFVTHHLWHTIFHTTSPHTIFHTPSQTIFHTPLCHTPSLAHTIFGTWSFTHHFVTHHLSHTIFDTPSYTHHLSPHHLSHTTLSQTIFPPPPPLSFLPSPSPLQNLLIIIGRSWLVGLCGPLTFFSIRSNSVLYAHHRHAAELHAPTGILYETIRCSSQVMDNAHVR